MTRNGISQVLSSHDTGLICMNARYYGSTLNRFLSADVIVPDFSNPQSLNRYSYVLNSPLKYRDPTGHCAAEGFGNRGQCTPVSPPSPPTAEEQVQRNSNIYGIQFSGDEGEAWEDWQMVEILTAAGDIERRFRMEGNFSGYRPGEIWQEIYGTVIMYRSSKTTYTDKDGNEQDITYGAETMGNIIEVYDTASSTHFNFRLNMVHEFGHRFNAVTENATDMSPYDELEAAIESGAVSPQSLLRASMADPPYQQSPNSNDIGELSADMFVNWTYRSFVGGQDRDWMNRQMKIWLGR